MILEARITVHQRGTQKPDYKDIHARMTNAGYYRVFTVGGHTLQELHGMYRKLSISTIDAEQTTIEQSLRSLGFAFSVELFQVAATRTFNLEPAPNYSAFLTSLIASR